MINPRQRPYRRRTMRAVAKPMMQPLERRVLLASAFIDPPAPPAVFLDTTYVPGTGTTHTVNAGGNLQTAINNAQLGDTIIVQAGATFSGSFSLPNKTTGSGWITIRTSASDSDLPPPGTRITPAHSSLMPKLVAPNDTPALGTTNGAHHYRFIGIEFTIASSVTRHTSGILRLGSGAETSTAQFPNNLIFDRVYIHGNTTGNIQNGIRLNSASTSLIDSYIENCQAASASGGFESHNIGGYNGPGPYKLVNNTFSGATIPVIFGGAATSIAGITPSDMEIRNNHFTRPRSWRPGDPSYDGSNWYVKNLFELKNGQRVLFDGNLLEHNWPQAGFTPDGSPQHGFAILLTVRNGGAQTTPVVQDITMTNNIIRKSNAGISLYGGEASGTRRIKIENNLFDDIGLNWDNDLTTSGNDRTGMLTQFQTVGDTVFNHNTIINDGDIMFANGNEVADLDFTNNISNHNSARPINPNRGINAPGAGVGTPSLDAKFVQYLVTKNVMANASGYSYTGSAAGNFFPGSSATPGNFSSVGFTSLANRDYRLAPSSIYNNAATDGTDIGANIDALEAAVGGAVSLPISGTSGNDTYYLKRNGNLLEIYNNATGTGTPIVRDMLVYYESLVFNTGGGDDKVIVDYSGGNPVPAGGVFFDGATNSSGDIVQIIGNGGAATYNPSGNTAGRGVVDVAGGVVTLLGAESLEVSNISGFTLTTPNAVDTMTIDSPAAGKNRISGTSGAQPLVAATISSSVPLTVDAGANDAAGGSIDSLSIHAASGSNVRFIGGAGNDLMTITGGSIAFDSDLGEDSTALAVTVNTGAALTFGATQHLRSLSVNGTATMSPNGSRAIVTGSLAINGGTLNLNDNDMVVNYTGGSPIGSWNGSAYTSITGWIQSGRNGGAWNGDGIVTAMSSAGAGVRTLAVKEASELLPISGTQTAMWNGHVVDGTSVLVKYSYAGDLDLDGDVDGDDYFVIDSHVAQSGLVFGYGVGDIDLDGDIDGDDYFWIDGNIAGQGLPL